MDEASQTCGIGLILIFSQPSVSVVLPDWSYLLYLINQSLTFYFISLNLMSPAIIPVLKKQKQNTLNLLVINQK